MAAGVGSGMLPVPYGMAGIGGMLPLDATASIPQPMPITALASALANTSPDQQRTMLGENLYPLVDQLEHEHSAKVTGMLLEMDQTEVLHLLESPDALKEKVAEAGVMDIAAAMNLLPDSPMSPGFSQQMSPSGNGGQHSSVAWPQPNVPTLHLPGSNLQSSRLRSSLSARDIPLEDLSLLQDYESQQLLNDFTCYSVSLLSTRTWIKHTAALVCMLQLGQNWTLEPETLLKSNRRFGKGWDQQVQRTMVMVSSDQPTFQSKKKKLGSVMVSSDQPTLEPFR